MTILQHKTTEQGRSLASAPAPGALAARVKGRPPLRLLERAALVVTVALTAVVGALLGGALALRLADL